MDNKTKKGIMLGLLLLGCGLTSLVGGMLGSSNNGAAILRLEDNRSGEKTFDTRNKAKQGNMLKVYVSGAVARPGLYDVPMGARADDAVLAAGGMTMEADPTRVNLALKLKDGMQVNVPFMKGKYSKQYGNVKNNYNNNNNGNAKANNNTSKENVKININTASAQELESLPGIGANMAQRIISYRNQHRFNSIEDLVKVPGIGKAKLERLRDRVAV